MCSLILLRKISRVTNFDSDTGQFGWEQDCQLHMYLLTIGTNICTDTMRATFIIVMYPELMPYVLFYVQYTTEKR